jgi:integrase
MDESKFTIPVMYDANGDLKSRWYVQFSYLNPETQKMQRFRYWVSTRYKTKTARRKKALDMQEHYTRRLKQGWSPFKGELPEHTLLTDAILFILQIKKGQSRGVTGNNYQSVANKVFNYLKCKNLNNLPCYGFTDAMARDIMDKIAISKVSNVTYNNNLTILRAIFNELVARNYFEFNPFKKVKKIKQLQGKIQPFSKKDFKKFYEYLEIHDPQLLLFCKFLFYTGFRPVEVTRLKIEDIDFANGILTLKAEHHKTGRQRGMKLKDSFLLDLNFLQDYIPNLHIFSTDNMKPGIKMINTRQIQQRYFDIKEELGLKNRLYDLKHTMATHLIKQNVNVMDVQFYLGHQDINDTMTYVRSVQEYSSENLKDLIPDMRNF